MTLTDVMKAINEKRMRIRDLVEQDKLDDAKKEKEELEKLQNKYDLMKELEEQGTANAAEHAPAAASSEPKKKNSVKESFVNVVKAAVLKRTVSEEDRDVFNMMKEGTDEDGGLTVPVDVSTTIRELRRSQDALELLVNVESVSTNSGSRVIEVNADQVPFDNVDEAAEFPEVDTPTLKKIQYKIKKKGGILEFTRELFQDSAENILRYLTRWIAKKAKATRNALIVAKIGEITTGHEVAISTVDNLKDIFNVKLDPAIAVTSGVLTNQDGFNFLDKLKDEEGNYILQPDVTQKTDGLLFGRYPIHKVSNKTLKTATGKAPVICGDLKEAITIFDRETLTVETSSTAGDLWGKDLTGIKVRERLDCQSVDTEAIIKGQVTVGE